MSWSEKDSIDGPSPVMRVRPIDIHVSKDICSIAFLANGKHLVAGGYGGKVRTWRTEDGQEVDVAVMNAGSTTVLNIAAFGDGKRVVAGTSNGRAIVWEVERQEKVTEIQGHDNWVRAVDVSADMTRIASGSDDRTVCVWSVLSGERLLGPLEHDHVLASVKFSPNGHFLATATWWKESVRVYSTQDGTLLIDLPVRVVSYANQSLAWALDHTLLFTLSFDGDVKCCDLSTGTVRSRWSVSSGQTAAKCMVVARNGKFIAVSTDSFIRFWDTALHNQIGPLIHHTDTVHCMAISPNYDLAAGGGKTITIQNLDNILPPHCVDDVATTTNASIGHFSTVTNFLGSMPDMAPDLYNDYFPNDLTCHVRRDGHDPVASGGFADIYRAMLQTNWEPMRVAIKAIRTYSADDSKFFKKHKRLRREIRIWLTLKHINVLPLLGTTAGFGRFPAMVCPWVENGSLTTYLEDYYEGLSVIEILTLVNDAACGLEYLHSCSVVHGDLSGSNVLVSNDGRAYISDFGLSTLLTELGGTSFATSIHERGTLRWTAPELLDLEVSEDEEPPQVISTKHSDVYSFGGVMLQTLTGKVPYHYFTREAQVVHAVSKGMTPRRPSNVLVTDRRWMFVQGCWSNPSQSRPSSEGIVYFTDEELRNHRALMVQQQNGLIS